jgi:hypothetical protein
LYRERTAPSILISGMVLMVRSRYYSRTYWESGQPSVFRVAHQDNCPIPEFKYLTISHYRIGEKVDPDGNGEVYRVEDTNPGLGLPLNRKPSKAR